VELRAQDRIRLVVDGAERTYRGRITARASHGRLLLVNHVPLEDYLRGVLPGEMPHDWPMEALAAQAGVARSFAVAEMGRHSRDGYDFCDLTHCQAYRGASWERQSTDRAVRMTAGRVLAASGKVIPAPYHSTCGGKTCANVEYLTYVDDSKNGKAYCAESDHSRWTSAISADDLGRALKIGGTITDIRLLGRDSTGRVTKIEIKVDRVTAFTASEFQGAVGRDLGWMRIKSAWFDVRKSGDSFIFTGRGLGHGMGLCQWGARGMARHGRSCEEILRHYYPRCRIERK
jgi:stage II sporulation protein D